MADKRTGKVTKQAPKASKPNTKAATGEKEQAKKSGNSRIRRTVMGTLSGVFMASAIIVAAIPVKKAQAVDTADLEAFRTNYAVAPEATGIIPSYNENTPVFFDRTGIFGSAYVSRSAEMVGVVAYFDSGNSNITSNIIIPEEMPAFQYDPNNNLAAVSGDTKGLATGNNLGDYLCFVSQEAVTEDVEISGNTVTNIISPEVIEQCLASNYDQWKDKELYTCTFKPDGTIEPSNPKVVRNHLVIRNAYIGSSRYVLNNAGTSIDVLYEPTATIANKPVNALDRAAESGASFSTDYGVFQGATNFKSVTIPDKIIAIGQNAFRDCQMLSVSLGGNLTDIGNNAFRNCIKLSNVTFAESSNLKRIGDFSLAGCTSLTNISIPDSTLSIGSGCFMGDRVMSAVNLYGSKQDGNTALNALGDGVFYECEALTAVHLPNALSNQDTMEFVFKYCTSLSELTLSRNPGTANNGEFQHTNVTGCYSLKLVTVPGRNTTFECSCPAPATGGLGHKDGAVADCVFGKANLGVGTPFTESFKVDEEFAIKCFREEDLTKESAYKYACEHEYAVGYLNEGYEGQYERVINNYFYTVDENNKLIRFGKFDTSVDSEYVVIPDHVGSHYISQIDEGTFTGNDEIKYLYIPSTVSEIADNSFKDCKNISEVEFEDALAVQKIGKDAFKTNATDNNLQLRFTGTIAPNSAPFNYAMTPGNNYNDSSLPVKYISYTSQFPYNLEVELVVEKDELTQTEIVKAVPTLVGAPDYDDFSSGNYSLSTYPVHVSEQNDIVRKAFTKYRSHSVSGNDVQYSEDEQKVIDAVFKPNLPTGIFGIKDDVYQDNDAIESVIMNSVEEIPANAFKGCDDLKTVVVRSTEVTPGEFHGGKSIGDNSFADCPDLTTVILPDKLESIGHLPFQNDTALETVDFGGNPQFNINDGIIKEILPAGVRLVECLPTRGDTVGTGKIKESEFADVTEMDDGAFMDCPYVTQALFGDSLVTAIPDSCFENCTRLNYCEVSPKTKSIGNHAFRNTALSDIKIPASVDYIAENAFTEDDGSGGDKLLSGLNIQCEDPSTALSYANRLGFKTGDRIPHKWSVQFYDNDGNPLGSEQLVEDGTDAVPPEAPKINGMKFVRWRPSYQDVSSDLMIFPVYINDTEDPISGNNADKNKEFTVTFYNYDGSMKISVQKVKYGESATTPASIPERDGYTFTGWLPEYNNVVSDLDVYPQYKGSGSNSDDPNNNGNNNNNSGPTPDNGNSNNSNTNNGTNPTNNSSSNTTNPTNNTQPTNNSTVNPTSQTDAKKTDTTANTNKTNTSTTTSKTASSTKANTSNGTKVQVNKSGISNPGLATATVAGSTDDFVVKITDSSDATSLVEQALYGEYGDLSNIRYMGFDISLYDSTGTTKIQNTDNLSVTVTMPIPDALKTYGGNNKAGAVSSSNTLEKLETRFTTINGVPCMSFVAKHFSPYTIYVDLNNLTASGYNDVTPKTADPIHPKWFLSIGLGIMSVLMFVLKGSKRKVIKVIS